MANEIIVRANLTVRKGNLQYTSSIQGFQATLNGTKGPTPGSITVATGAGTDVDLSQLSNPGLCEIVNTDSTNFVRYGIRDPVSNVFYPLGRILPGENFVLRLDNYLGEEFPGAGTGSHGAGCKLHFRADTAAVVVQIFAFDN